MSGNARTRRRARRAEHLAAYRADGRFSSLGAFIENERLAEALTPSCGPILCWVSPVGKSVGLDFAKSIESEATSLRKALLIPSAFLTGLRGNND